MPEEINRIVTDHISDILFCPTVISFNNLIEEGIGCERLFLTGDIMVDTYKMFNQAAEKNIEMVHNLGNGEYYIATIHRASNTDDPKNLKNIIEAFEESGKFIIFPIDSKTFSRNIS
jgi:UDP-N-acetylglucosamine 2-epimerase (non-hydrolysing)